MSKYKLNPLLIENLTITKNHLNGFDIKCLSKSTDMSTLLEEQLQALVKHIELEEMVFSNLLVQTRTIDFNHVEFLIGAREVYDVSDTESALTWLPHIINALTEARGFVPTN